MVVLVVIEMGETVRRAREFVPGPALVSASICTNGRVELGRRSIKGEKEQKGRFGREVLSSPNKVQWTSDILFRSYIYSRKEDAAIECDDAMMRQVRSMMRLD